MFSTVVLASISIIFLAEDSSQSTTDPCSTQNRLGSSGKRSITYDSGTCDGRLCDNSIKEGEWYTLDSETTGNRMPESCVPVWRCGTYIPIWMNGAHPTADNQGPITVEVCAQLRVKEDCCAWRDKIRVKYCNNAALGDYYVYQLKNPPYCDMAYCGGNGVYCGTDAAWNDIKSNCTTPKCPAVRNVVMSDPFILETKAVQDVNGNGYTARKFGVRCSFSYDRAAGSGGGDDGARFDVVFAAGGDAIARFSLESSATSRDYSAVMDESYLAGYLDRNLSCRVYAYWKSPYPNRCLTISSRAVYYGFQVLNEANTPVQTIDIEEGERKIIYIRATFPITTPGCLNLLPGTRCNPSHTFRISTQKVLLSNCSFQLSYENPTSFKIIISPIPTTYTVYGPYVWPMNFSVQGSIQDQGSALAGCKSANKNISIIDSKPRPQCQSTTDPNIYTFFSSYYTLTRVIGDFYLVRNPEPGRNLEIQVRHNSCFGSASCNCGVMAREGNNVVGIDMCSQPYSPRLIRYLIDLNNPGGEIDALSYCGGWRIRLLSGIEIDVTNRGSFLNIVVRGLAVEVNKYDGLCSHNSRGNPDVECDQAFRVPPQESLFTITSANPPRCKESTIIPSCDCSSSTSQNVPCFVPDQSNIVKTNFKCPTTTSRRKRDAGSTDDLFENVINVDDLHNTNLTGFLPNRALTWPTPRKGITEKNATDTCTAALRLSPVFQLCTAKVNVTFIIEACKTDIQATETLDLTEDVPRLLETLCVNAINSSFVSTANDSTSNSQPTKDLSLFNDAVCPEGCNQRGDCSKGVCRCVQSYSGTTCGIDRRVAPVIQRVWSSPCDVQQQKCTVVTISATGASDRGLTCKIRAEYSISYDMSPIVEANMVHCSLPESGVNPEDSGVFAATNKTFYVSLSNDNQTYSADVSFTIYDGLCMTCSNDSKCSIKASTCSIGGRCYSSGYSQNCTEELVICKPDICQTRWSTKNSKSCQTARESCLNYSSPLTINIWLLGLLMAGTVFITAKRNIS